MGQHLRNTGLVLGVCAIGWGGLVLPAAGAAVAGHLILSEIVIKTRPPASTFGSPFIEIVNPTVGDLELSQVHLTDGATAPNVYYHNLTLASPETDDPGGGHGGDFHARFPDGYVLAAGKAPGGPYPGVKSYES